MFITLLLTRAVYGWWCGCPSRRRNIGNPAPACVEASLGAGRMEGLAGASYLGTEPHRLHWRPEKAVKIEGRKSS